MRKPVLAILVFITLAGISIPTFGQITETPWTWLGTANSGGFDAYYNRNVTAYATGAQAVLMVTIKNTEGTTIDITKVWVTFDWGASYVSTQVNATTGKITLKSNEFRVVSINFTVPDVSVASNLYTHSYTVTANFTGGLPLYIGSQNDFAIYSPDQAAAMDLKRIVNSYPSLFANFSVTTMSAQAQILWNEATNETATADRYYEQGNFATAKQSYSNALNDKNQAFAAEQSYLTMLQDLQTQRTQAEIRYLDAWTSFFNGLSTMWVLFGIGWVLLGLGYIVKWLRKRPEPQTATA
jgi:hypothetical protein